MDRASIVLIVVLSIVWRTHAAVNCTAAGRVADPDDTTCQNYTLCVYNSTSATYLAYSYVCPSTSVFNPNTALCTAASNYECTVNTTTADANTTTVCTADGYIADPNSSNCSSYIECVDLGNGTYAETVLDCPTDTYFNPNTTNCESDYNCTSTSDFTCTAAGRFADTTDTTCQTYYFCVLSSTGTYAQYNYTCPSTSLFNPNTSVCTISYTCSQTDSTSGFITAVNG